MSSDESTSTQLSKFSNRGENKEKIKPHKPEQWEINLIGNFLLDLYHRCLIGLNNDWNIKKIDMRKEYSNIMSKELGKKLKDLNGTSDIGTLLHRCGFLINTPRGSNYFKIKYSSLFEYRNTKLKELDDLKINNDDVKQLINNDRGPENVLSNLLQNKSNILLEDNYEIDENVEKIPLEYQCTGLLRRKENYIPTNMSCCICQEDFTTMENYEEHIQIHGEETDFEFLNTMVKRESPLFKITYSLCKNSHYFCFEIETNEDNLIIEKIIIVQSRSFYYVHNMRVPYKYPDNGKDRFFVDSHLFTIHVEQPIVLIVHHEDRKEVRIIEQHHFMRSEEFPKVQFSINPYRLPNKKLFKPKFGLADYLPPKEIQDALKDDFYYEKLMKTSNEFRDYVRNGKNLQPHNIGASINILLQIDDMDTILQYVRLTQKNIKLRSYGDEYSFRLKLKQRIFIENILSPYDEVILTSRTDILSKDEEVLQLMMQNKSDIERMKNTFVGIIQAVNTGRISFKCDKKINLQSQYTVICRPSRLNFRYQYRSLELLPVTIDFLKKFLFPARLIPRPLSNTSIELYNWNINGEQLQAVRNIYEGPRNDATYIIFGPPGTGKTTTLVEGILQLLRKPNTKILVTASSNSACDEIAKRLCKYLKNLDIKRAMVRIYSRSSEVRTETIDDELLENSNMYNGQFYPDIEILHEYRIVICTLSVVAKLATGKFGRSENGTTLYTHLIMDEIAATTEAEALIGITTALSPKSCLIIAGDHKQLGPILKSKRAEELGLGASLMDRLMARDCYRVDVDTGDYDHTIQTRLVRNYRSHPAIVNLYSGLYYNHSLESYAKKDDVSLCEIWHKSRNKQYPIMFHAIYEPSRTDNQSQSLYNHSEINVVMDYVKDLMYFGINGKPVKENDIGIISPYKKQFRRIQEELNLRKWFGIETGSVETFQGKEKDIIIASFVRSGTSSLGFLDNPRRLNVAISRPKSLLILIGNPQTLSLNSDFEYIIKECQRNNTFVGSNRPKKVELKKETTENAVNKREQLSVLNKGLATLKLDNMCLRKDVEISNDTNNNQEQLNKKETKSRRRYRNNKSNNENFNRQKEDNNVKKDKNNDDNDDDDDDDDESNSDNEDDGNKISASALNTNKTKAKINSRRGRRGAAKGELKNYGKITKQYGRGKQNNVKDNQQNLNKNNIDSLLVELPRPPNTNVHLSNPQYSQIQQPVQQYFNSFPQQPSLFNTYNNPNINHVYRQPVPLQLYTSSPINQQRQYALYQYANSNIHTLPNTTTNNNMNTNANTSEQKKLNTNNTNYKNNDSNAKQNKTKNRLRKSSKVAANIHKTATVKNLSNTGAIPKLYNTNDNQNKYYSNAINIIKSKEISNNSLNSVTANNSASSLKQLNQNKSINSPSKPSSDNGITTNKTILTKPSANIYPSIREVSSNITSTAATSSVKANLTTSNLSTLKEITSSNTSSTIKRANSTFASTSNYNPPTNPYLSTYQPSAPYFNANGQAILCEDNNTSERIRPIRNIANGENDEKISQTSKKDKCIIS